MRGECCTCSDRLNYVKLCEKYDQLESIHKVLVEDNLTYENQIADLEAKLAEKDELIGILKNKYECADRELYLTKDTLKRHTNIYNSLVESKYQDKISFAVEQLEKVKNGIESKVESIYKRLDDLNIKIVCESISMQLDTYKEISKEIDNQIKQLKEGK